ncbi:hypothetical protein MP228_002531 [Amoeboaphelidium protococcarum]|nr:hypothetical protein MP228_002531 [Amoeboaphelidium protococcarum]
MIKQITNPTDLAIFSYLKQRGYRLTEQQFLQEVQQSSSKTGTGSDGQDLDEFLFESALLDTSNPLHNTVLHFASQDLGGSQLGTGGRDCIMHYVDQLKKVVQYIESSSLDQYKQEMFAIVYPLYVYCLLECCKKGGVDECVELYRGLCQLFYEQMGGDSGNDQSMSLNQEIQQIGALLNLSPQLIMQDGGRKVKSSQQQAQVNIQMLNELIKSSEVAQLYLNNKYTISMSSLGWEMLFGFCIGEGLSKIVSVVMRFLNVKVYTTSSVGVSSAINASPNGDKSRNVHGGHAVDLEDGINGQHVSLGVPSDLVTSNGDLQKGAGEDNGEDGRLTVKQAVINKLRDQKVALENYIQSQVSENCPLQQVPLPPKNNMDVMKQLQRFQDYRNRVQLSGDAAALPSIVTYTIHNSGNTVTSCRFSPDFKVLATGSSDSYIKLYSLTRSNGVNSEKQYSEYGDYLQDGPRDAGHLKSMKGSTEFDVQDFEDAQDWSVGAQAGGHFSRKLIGHSGPVYDMAFLSDSDFMLSCSEDGTVRGWSLDTMTNLVRYKAHNYPVWCLDASANAPYFVSGSADKTCRLFNVERVAPLRIFCGHLSDVDQVRFHPNNAYVLSSSSDKTMRLWDINRGGSNCVRLFTGNSGNTASAGTGVQSPYASGGHSRQASITALRISPNGAVAASGADDGSVVVWDLASTRVLFHIPFGANTQQDGSGNSNLGDGVSESQRRSVSSVYSLDFSADSYVLAVGFADGTVTLWDLQRTFSPSPQFQQQQQQLVQSAAQLSNGASMPRMISTCRTKRTPLHEMKFTPRNVLFTAGPFTPY